jgi:hypothetical protein
MWHPILSASFCEFWHFIVVTNFGTSQKKKKKNLKRSEAFASSPIGKSESLLFSQKKKKKLKRNEVRASSFIRQTNCISFLSLHFVRLIDICNSLSDAQ